MLEAIEHRGDRLPQLSQIENVSLGCARLAIVGRDQAQQPLTDSTNGITVVFNGEIYNHRNLNREITGSNNSPSDTQVILESYKKWGIDYVNKLDGMFSILLYDSSNGVVYASRDYFGIKPLYFLKTKQSVYFASEIKAITTVVPKDELAQGVKAVPPGSTLHCSVAVPYEINEIQNQILPDIKIPKSEEGARRKLREFVRDAVWSMLDTDLPVGVLCSGGIDSSVILYEAMEYKKQRNCQLDLTAYCVGVPEPFSYPRPDSIDSVYANYEHNQILQKLSMTDCQPLKIVNIELGSVIKLIPEVISSIETFEPNHIRAGIANLALMKEIHEDGIKVVLVGEGADELLGGYHEFVECIAKYGYGKQLDEMFDVFSQELHKTQLKRVDRLSMACGIEARVPFLSKELASFISALPNNWKIPMRNGKAAPKAILREAYKRTLSRAVWARRKVPMGEGAGVGDNGDGGHFYENARKFITHQKAQNLMKQYPSFKLKDDEEAWYFHQFLQLFGPLSIASNRPTTNILPTEEYE
tara:strand:- start:18820 stop:20403 length:1584 start_codon:yes stop_codon:yes gene_type:complete